MSGARTSLRAWMIGLGLIAAGLAYYLLTAETPDDALRDSAERIKYGKQARPEADFVTGLWWAAVANLVLTIGLLATVKLWVRPLSAIVSERGFAGTRVGRGFFLALLAVMALAGAMRWNLAHSGHWWDELWRAKYGIVGYYLGDATEPLEDRYFAEATWQRALWHYTRPTNHPAASFPARLSHMAWRSLSPPSRENGFSEFAVRFPNWLASLGAVGFVGLVGGLWGRPLAGILAALMLALHPWHIRYGIDLRGYSWMVLWTAAGLVWLTLMFRSEEGRARWWPWLGFGLNQALLVWAFPHAVFVAAAYFVIAGGLVFICWPEAANRRSALSRLIVVNLAGGMIFLQLFAPNLIQIPRWWEEVESRHSGHGLDLGLFRLFLGEWLTGMPWQLPLNEEREGLVSLTDRAGAGLLRGLLGILLGIFVIGFTRLWREQRLAAIATGASLLAGVGILGFFAITQSFFYPRFLVFLVVPLVLLIGVAGDWEMRRKRASVLVAALAMGVFCWLVTPQWRVLMSRPFSPMRDVAVALSEIKENSERPVIYACYGHGLELFPIYWPEMRGIVSLAELSGLAEEAKEKDARLLVTYGHAGYNRAEMPDGFTWLDDPERFEMIGRWPGIDAEQTFHLLEWTGGGRAP